MKNVHVQFYIESLLTKPISVFIQKANKNLEYILYILKKIILMSLTHNYLY